MFEIELHQALTVFDGPLSVDLAPTHPLCAPTIFHSLDQRHSSRNLHECFGIQVTHFLRFLRRSKRLQISTRRICRIAIWVRKEASRPHFHRVIVLGEVWEYIGGWLVCRDGQLRLRLPGNVGVGMSHTWFIFE